MGLKEAARIWGIIDHLIRGRRAGERTLMGKKMTFRKDKWALRRILGRWDIFMTMSV